MSSLTIKDTSNIRKRYDRWAAAYDYLEGILEILAFRRWRKLLLTYARGRICEIGIGTGRNQTFYPQMASIFGFDISQGMLRRLRQKNSTRDKGLNLALMDAQKLALRDNSFDTMLATFVFCTVPEPVQALKEAWRACKPGGRLLLMEHVRSNNPIMGRLMDLLNPLALLWVGDNINRRTADNVKKAGWNLKELKRLGFGIVNIIVAEKTIKSDVQ